MDFFSNLQKIMIILIENHDNNNNNNNNDDDYDWSDLSHKVALGEELFVPELFQYHVK